MDRIAAFKDFIARAPDDPFPRYGLAMEYRAQGRFKEAVEVFEELARRAPSYVATYLMFGNTLAQLGDGPAAASAYRRGIEVCSNCGDEHTRREIESALAELGNSE